MCLFVEEMLFKKAQWLQWGGVTNIYDCSPAEFWVTVSLVTCDTSCMTSMCSCQRLEEERGEKRMVPQVKTVSVKCGIL